MTSKFTRKDIETTFKEKEIQFPIEDFIQALEQKETQRKELNKAKLAEKAAKPEIIELEDENILPEPDASKGETAESLIKKTVNNKRYWDMFYDYDDGMDDDGDDAQEYYRVGDKFYVVDIHCEAEWISDWSMRKNVPGKVSVTLIRELPNCKSIEKNGQVSIEVPRCFFPPKN